MTLTRSTPFVAVIIALLLATFNPSIAFARMPVESPIVPEGKIFLTLIIVQPGYIASLTENDSDSDEAVYIPPANDITPEESTECPGNWTNDSESPHPCPQFNRTGQDNAEELILSPIPSPMPEPKHNNQ